MGVHSYDDLLSHWGHKLACVVYDQHPKVKAGGHCGVCGHYGGDCTGATRPQNVAIECVDCGVVLIDFDRPSVSGTIRVRQ